MKLLIMSFSPSSPRIVSCRSRYSPQKTDPLITLLPSTSRQLFKCPESYYYAEPSFMLLCIQTETDKSAATWRSWKHFPSVLLLTSEWMTALILWSRGQVWWWQLSFNIVGDAICRHIPDVMKEIKLHNSKRLHCVLSRRPLQLSKAPVRRVCCSRRQCRHRSSPERVFQI
jgi:hypothetical protein